MKSGVCSPSKSPQSLDLLNAERGNAQAGVENDGLRLKIENGKAVQELLDVKRYLGTNNSLVITELDLYRNVEEAVIVGMDIVGNCRR